MSETVYYSGILEKLHRKDGESLEEQCKRFLNNESLDSQYNSYQDWLLDVNYENYYIYKGDLYRIHKAKNGISDDLFLARRVSHSKIKFELMYYNGGCGFEEALDIAIKNLELE